MSRLNVYLLLDTSGSMNGDPITAVNVGLASMLRSLRNDPHCREVVSLSVHTFDALVKEVLPLTPIAQLEVMPTIRCPASGPTFLGEGLLAIIPKVRNDGVAPLLLVMTDGSPTDLQVYEEATPKIHAAGFGRIVGFAVGPKAKPESLLPLTPDVTRLESADGASFLKLFDAASRAVGESSRGALAETPLPTTFPSTIRSTATSQSTLPPPPTDSFVL